MDVDLVLFGMDLNLQLDAGSVSQVRERDKIMTQTFCLEIRNLPRDVTRIEIGVISI